SRGRTRPAECLRAGGPPFLLSLEWTAGSRTADTSREGDPHTSRSPAGANQSAARRSQIARFRQCVSRLLAGPSKARRNHARSNAVSGLLSRRLANRVRPSGNTAIFQPPAAQESAGQQYHPV